MTYMYGYKRGDNLQEKLQKKFRIMKKWMTNIIQKFVIYKRIKRKLQKLQK